MAGVSERENKHLVRDWIDKLNPESVLDIGAGVGTYAIMCWRPGQYWVALEAFEPYVEMFNLGGKYDEVWIDDARNAVYSRDFELIIAADMLEHMHKQEAKDLVAKLLTHCKYLLICFPVVHNEQQAGDEGNSYETHIDHWSADEMSDYLTEIEHPEFNRLVGDVCAYYFVKGDL